MILFVKEALEAIRGGRVRRGRGARFPKQPHIIVAIRIRGEALFVRNDTHCLTLALRGPMSRALMSLALQLAMLSQATRWPMSREMRSQAADADRPAS